MLSEVFVFKQQTADEMRISDWSSDVCSSDLGFAVPVRCEQPRREPEAAPAGIDQGHRNHRQGGQDPEKGNDDKRDTVKIGRASCRERVCQYVELSGVAV